MLVILSIVAASAFGQLVQGVSSPLPGYIGEVYTAGGAPIQGATASLTGTVSSSQSTDSQGRFMFTNLPAGGNYTITVSYPGVTFDWPSYGFYNAQNTSIMRFSQTCTFTAPLIHNHSWQGTTRTAAVTTDPTCQWAPAAVGPSITVSPASNTGNGTLSVGRGSYGGTVAPRTGAVTLGSTVFRFTQAAQYLHFWYTFWDVPYSDSSHDIYWDQGPKGYSNYIALMKQYIVTNGCGTPGYFCPEDYLTRGQLTAMLVRAVLYKSGDCDLTNPPPNTSCSETKLRGWPASPSNPDGFTWPSQPYYTDVPSGSVFFPYIRKRHMNPSGQPTHAAA